MPEGERGYALDFETSAYSANSACALGLTYIEGDSLGDSFYTLIRPPSSRVLFTEIHGLTWQDLKDAPTFGHIWPTIAQYLTKADFLVAHNAPFDRRVLMASLKAIAVAPLEIPFLCTLKGARKAIKLPSRSLDSLCAYYQIPLNHHHAASDAHACAEIYLRLRRAGQTQASMRLAPLPKS